MPSVIASAAVAGSIGSSLIGASSASDAADASNAATKLQVGEQQREYDQTRSDYAPYRATGASALDTLAKIYGLDTSVNGATVPGSPGKGPDYSSFYESPDYQFKMQQGIAGVDAGASATGSLDSGATRKAEIGYAGNLASSSFNDYANRLAGIAGVGQTATAGTAAAGQNTANNISNAYLNQGNVNASAALARGSSYGTAIQQLSGIGASVGTGLIQNQIGSAIANSG